MKELLKVLKPLKTKIIIEKFINSMLLGLAIGLCLCSVVIILSKIIFINNVINYIYMSLIIGLIFAIIIMVVNIPNNNKIAIIGDNLGFNERFITAIEIINNKKTDEPIYKLVVEDALKQGKNADFRKLYKINISNKMYITVALLLIISISSGFIPTWKADDMEKKAQLQQIISKQINNINEISKEIKNPDLNKELKILKKELEKSDTDLEAIQEIQKTQQQLKKIENISKEEIEKILNQSKISDNKVTDENKLEQSYENKQSDSDENKQSDKTSNNISPKTQENLNKNKDTKETANKINETLNSSIKEIQNNIQKQTDKQNNNSNQTQKNTNKQETTQQKIDTNKSNSQQPKAGGTSRGNGNIPNKNIYTRDLENISGTKFELQGDKNQGGTEQESENKEIGQAGEIVSYDKVYNQYKQEALKTLSEDNIPYGMRNLVEEYFSSLE